MVLKVPAYNGTLTPPDRERVRALRRHLVEFMRDAREVKREKVHAGTEPGGFAGQVARAACTVCKGWCCSKGDAHAYLDGPSLLRVRREHPDLNAWEIIRRYTSAVASPGFAGSCVFHGPQGCTLERGLRSDLCGKYFCSELGAFVSDAEEPPVEVRVYATDPAGKAHRQVRVRQTVGRKSG